MPCCTTSCECRNQLGRRPRRCTLSLAWCHILHWIPPAGNRNRNARSETRVQRSVKMCKLNLHYREEPLKGPEDPPRYPRGPRENMLTLQRRPGVRTQNLVLSERLLVQVRGRSVCMFSTSPAGPWYELFRIELEMKSISTWIQFRLESFLTLKVLLILQPDVMWDPDVQMFWGQNLLDLDHQHTAGI